MAVYGNVNVKYAPCMSVAQLHRAADENRRVNAADLVEVQKTLFVCVRNDKTDLIHMGTDHQFLLWNGLALFFHIQVANGVSISTDIGGQPGTNPLPDRLLPSGDA